MKKHMGCNRKLEMYVAGVPTRERNAELQQIMTETFPQTDGINFRFKSH